MNGVVDYIDAVHEAHWDDGAMPSERGQRVHDLFRAHEITLLTPLLEFLESRNDVNVLGPTDPAVRLPTVAVLSSRNPHDVAKDLVDHKVMAGAGNFYGLRVIEGMGIPSDPGVLRVSFVHYTSPDEIDQLIRALDVTL